MKKILVILTIFTAIELVACSHKNPMETEPKEKTAQFLLDASTYAEIKINYKIKNTDHGIIYGACMDKHFANDLTKEDCKKFYHYMVEYAHQSNSNYENITYEDLINEQAYTIIEEDYGRIWRETAIKKTKAEYANKKIG